ncbi:MAG TPA: Crp/Fnr family transcriptional regulator [Candidatus Saccharimonadales bacterium]|nr:Crp/Fnr family transcriptional regulator [Candidatus Saccharimonadales bacterium]
MRNLTVESVKGLFPRSTVRRYDKNQIICYHGDKPQHIFFVLKGHVRYYDIDEQGNEKILHINGPQNIFPMLYAFDVTDEVNGFYCSIDNVEVLSIPLKDFHEVIKTNIEFSNNLVLWFLNEIEQLVYRLNSLEKTDSRVKILYALKSLALNHGQATDEWHKIGFPITQQFIADFTGLARETVSSTMHELEKDKIVRTGKLRSLEVKRKELDKLS